LILLLMRYLLRKSVKRSLSVDSVRNHALAWLTLRTRRAVDCLTGLFAQFKSDRLPGFPLLDRCAISRIAARSDILDPDRYYVTATKLAVDRQIEHGEVWSAAFDLEFCLDQPDMSRPQR
jgi:hypothetical protein